MMPQSSELRNEEAGSQHETSTKPPKLYLAFNGLQGHIIPDDSTFQELMLHSTAEGIRQADHVTPSNRKFGTNFSEKLLSLGQYNSLADSDRGVFSYAHSVYTPRILLQRRGHGFR
jgi:hypothetical protein